MTVLETSPVSVTEPTYRHISWGAVVAGAFAAVALAGVLHSFAAAIGLSISSTAPTWRDASFALVFLSGLYLVLAALASYGLGGYIAGRLAPIAPTVEGTEFRDGMNGLLVWALATILTGFLLLAAAAALSRQAAPSSGSAGPAASVASENIIAYDLDRLLRADRRPQGDMTYTRAEAGRILMTTSSHRGMLPEDRAYLVRLVALTTGLAPPDAERRVNEISAQAKQNIDRARRSGVILAFMTGAAALLGALAAWFAAIAAGRHRDGHEALHTLWDWDAPRMR